MAGLKRLSWMRVIGSGTAYSASVLLAGAALMADARASDPAAPATAADLLSLEEMLTDRLRAVEEQQRQLERQIDEMNAQLEGLRQARAGLANEDVVPADRAAALRGAGTVGAGAATGAAAGAATVPAVTIPEPERPSAGSTQVAQQAGEPERPDLPIIVERGGVLLRQGRAVVEPSLEYNLTEVDSIEIAGFAVLPAILIGSFDVNNIERESAVGSLSFRYGITNRLQIQGRIPGVWREDTVRGFPLGVGASEETTTRLDALDIGDVELAANYQVNEGIGGGPFYVANLRVRFPTGRDPFEVDVDENGNPTELATGTGFYGIQPSVTAIFPTDPLVYYGNLSYTWNVERNVSSTVGDVDPGDVIGLNIGLGFALNEDTSLNFAYDHQIVEPTDQNGEQVEGSEQLQAGRLLIGSSYRLSESTSLNLTFGFGVTEDAPDLTATVRVPISFDLF